MIVAHYYTHKPGGFCERLYRLLRAAAMKEETVYLTLDAPAVNLARVTVKIIPFFLKRRKGFLFWSLYLPWSSLYMVFLLFRLKSSAIVAFGPLYAFLAVPCSIIHRVPVTLFCRSESIREHVLLSREGVLLRTIVFFEKIGLVRANRAVFIHNAMRKLYEESLQIPLKNTAVLANDITTSLSSAPERLQKIVSIGRLTILKNHSQIIEAISELPSQMKASLKLEIVGEGPEKNNLLEMIQRLGVSEQVHISPWTDNVEHCLQQSDLLVHPSLTEGMSNIVLQAIGMGVPVLLSDIPAHRSFNEQAVLYDVQSSCSLAKQLEILMNNGDEFRELRNATLNIRNRGVFDWDAMATRLIVKK